MGFFTWALCGILTGIWVKYKINTCTDKDIKDKIEIVGGQDIVILFAILLGPIGWLFMLKDKSNG